MNKIIKAFKSRTVWTIIIMFLVGGTEAITPLVSSEVTTPILFALGALATYFKLNPSQDY